MMIMMILVYICLWDIDHIATDGDGKYGDDTMLGAALQVNAN